MKIAIAITTKDRLEFLARAVTGHLDHMPPGAHYFIVDDGSNPPVEFDGLDANWHLFRFDENVGIPRAKNKGLELAEAWGADHIFLFDSDVWPIADNWWKPYIESPEPHLMYGWSDIKPGPLGNKHYYSIGKIMFEDDNLVSFSHPRGQVLYIDAKKVLPRVGGFDPVYGKGMVEHVDWTWRIYNAGLTTWRYGDVPGSDKLFYSIDEHENEEPDFESTITNEMRTTIDKANQDILHSKGDSSEYIEYREDVSSQPDLINQHNVILTGVYTGKPDFQINWGMRHNPLTTNAPIRTIDLDYVSTLRKSVNSFGIPLIVLNNIANKTSGLTEYVKTDSGIDPYKNRFIKIYQYLRDHEEIDNCWITDSGDVTMNRNPFPEMQPGKIYVGCEEKNAMTCHFMVSNTQHNRYYTKWLRMNYSRKLLNCGLLGGSRQDVLDFLHRMFYIWGYNEGNINLTDMLVFNVVAYEYFANRIIFGTGKVNNYFKSEKLTENGQEWFMHK